MYEAYFGLKEEPFSIAPDPHYLYMSQGHREALAHLLYGIERAGGFVLLTGEVGTGKTTVCRCLLDEIPDTTDVAFMLNPKLTVEELLATVCDEFGISYPDGNTSVKVFVSRINDYLLDVHTRGRRAVLIIEEAQNLSTDVLEQLRLLTNLETNQRKLLQIIMVAQPELLDKLSQPELRQLSQRITARYHLKTLSQKDVVAYVKYRLMVAGLIRGEPFPPAVLKRLFRLTAGVPRLINVLCDRALLGAYVQGKERVDLKTLKTAAREVSGRSARRRSSAGIAAGVLLALACALGGAYYWYGSGKVAAAPAVSVPAEPFAAAGTESAAYQALFGAWQIDYDPHDSRTVCEQARQRELTCMQGTGSLSDLKQMNKPAVLRLLGAEGTDSYAVLISLRGDEATLQINNERRSGRVDELSKHWSGEYLLLWRAPGEYRKELKPGERGPLVSWVAQRLAIGRQPRRTVRYDDDLVHQVKEFQRTKGLRPDGVVGPWTIMRLSALDGGEPALNDGPG